MRQRNDLIIIQKAFILGSCAWFSSPFCTGLPTFFKCIPIFLGFFLGAFLFGKPDDLLKFNFFTFYSFSGFIFSTFFALILKNDVDLFLQINMLFSGMLVYYLCSPYQLNPIVILWIVLLYVLPNAVFNSFGSGVSFESFIGGFLGRRTEFTIYGGTHHIMGTLGALCIFSAWSAVNTCFLNLMPVKKSLIFLTFLIGIFLLVSSGARSYIFGFLMSYLSFYSVIFLRKINILFAHIFPLLLVVFLYFISFFLGQFDDELQYGSLQYEGSQSDFTTGRNKLWESNIFLFLKSPWIGSRLRDVEPERVMVFDKKQYYLAADGSIMDASTESIFDYLLARDGLTALFTFSYYYGFFILGLTKQKRFLLLLSLFLLISSVGDPLLRITYAMGSFIFALLIIQAYKYERSSDT